MVIRPYNIFVAHQSGLAKGKANTSRFAQSHTTTLCPKNVYAVELGLLANEVSREDETVNIKRDVRR